MYALLHGLNEFINLLWRGRFLQLSVISRRVMKDRVAVMCTPLPGSMQLRTLLTLLIQDTE